jgi:hypothetical protein
MTTDWATALPALAELVIREKLYSARTNADEQELCTAIRYISAHGIHRQA